MNWVSYAEDIEELRQENEHYRRGIDALIGKLEQGPSLHEIQRIESDNRRLSEQLISRYKVIKADAEKLFQEALKLLQDPAVRLNEKIEKRTRQRDEARSELKKCKLDLTQCRASQARNLNKISDLGKANKDLENELRTLQDQLRWQAELKDVKRRK